MKKLTFLAAAFASAFIPAQAALLITEVSPTGSSASYGADWFELTNTGVATLDITGWKIDDSSPSFATAVAFRGITSIAAGESVVFFEGNTSGSNDATITTNFKNAWFGGSVPASFRIGAYGGSGVSLSSGGDAVNIYDAGGTVVASVIFGASTTGVSFDNAAGLNNTTISTLSAVGVNGAFTSVTGGEIGSPGTITAVPEPSTWIIGLTMVAFTGVLAMQRRRRTIAQA